MKIFIIFSIYFDSDNIFEYTFIVLSIYQLTGSGKLTSSLGLLLQISWYFVVWILQEIELVICFKK